MLTSYMRILRKPGALLFSITGALARMPVSMISLGIFLLVSAYSNGTFAHGGRVVACFVIASALAAIPHGRLLDRFGQSKMILISTIGFSLFSALLIVSTMLRWHEIATTAIAFFAGLCQPLIGTSVRSRWAHILDDSADLETAFTVETGNDLIIYVIGPALTILLATSIHPTAGLITAIVLALFGGIALTLQRGTEPPIISVAENSPKPPLNWGQLAPLTIGALSVGAVLGGSEATITAFTKEHGKPQLAALLVILWATGSIISGILTGAVKWKWTTSQRLRYGLVILLFFLSFTPFINSIWLLILPLLLAGFAIAPTLTAAISRVEEITPRARFSEAMGFLQMGIGMGSATGVAVSGWVIDNYGAQKAFFVSVIACAVGVIFALLAKDDATKAVSLD